MAKKSFILVVIGFLTASTVSDFSSRAGRNVKIENDWKEIQTWSKQSTPYNSLFITPPYLRGFRIYSERSIVGDWKDGTLAVWNSRFAEEWWQRMKDLNYYNRLTTDDFESIANKYNATHIIAVKPKELSFRLLHESEYFRIYKV